MKKILAAIILVLSFGACLTAGSPYFIFGKIYDADGGTGTASSANSFASVSIFREGIKNEIGEQNNGPEPGFPKKIYPALYNGLNITAYTYTDTGSSYWSSSPALNQKVIAVFESVNGKNGYTGETMIGVSSCVITAADINKSETILPDTKLYALLPPYFDGYSQGVLRIKWQAVNASRLVSYTVWRKGNNDADFEKIGITDINEYMDTNVIDGENYVYAVSANILWGGGNGAADYFITSRSRGSNIMTAAYPTPTYTATVSLNTCTPTFTNTVINTATPTPALNPFDEERKKNIRENKLIAFGNPVKGNVLKLGIYAEKNCHASISLFNMNAEKTDNFRIELKKGENITERLIDKLASGVYLIEVSLDYGDKVETLKKIKVAVIKKKGD